MKTFFISLLTCLTLIVSCTKETSIKLKNQQKELVINCTFNPDSTWKLWLSSTITIGEYSEYFPAINNATIQLYENGNPIGIMQNLNEGFYFLDSKPIVGNVYSIKVSALGFDSVMATDSIPKSKSKISNGEINGLLIEKKAPMPWVDLTYKVLPFSIKMTDSKTENNYFKLNASIRVLDTTQIPLYFYNGSNQLFQPRLLNSEDKNLESFSWEQSVLIFSDKTIIDSFYNLNAYITGIGSSSSNGIDNTKITPYYIDDAKKLSPFYNGIVGSGGMQAKEGTGDWKLEYSIELLTISETYYKYNKTRLLQQYNRTIPGSEFNNIYSNVIGGKGIFGGFQSHKLILQ